MSRQPDPQSLDDSWVNTETGTVDWGSTELMDVDLRQQEPLSVRNTAFLTEQLHAYLNSSNLSDSEDDAEERSEGNSASEPTSESESEDEDGLQGLRRKRGRVINLEQPNSEWFPWPDKETCVLDILRHVPRCSFSKKQNTAIHWAMQALGLQDLPSDRVMDDIDKALQPLCGVQSVRYAGKLGHIYYVNDLAAIISQEMANPSVRKKLHFLPQDSTPSLSEAWQASRWLHELDSNLTTPMIREQNQDFYIFEPTLLRDGKTVCVPTRWFQRDKDIWARVWKMQTVVTDSGPGWIVDNTEQFDLKSSDLMLSLPHLISTHTHHRLPDPRVIYGIKNNDGKIVPWQHTVAAEGNPWRKKASGHRVVAFPIWLYCDDTSGNMSKKWNKHNSFLFTAAGLPRQYVHQESNIHFLCTSNIAPPLEMLDGIVDQLKASQERGIWAWDSELRELVLVIPSVLAMLGDNPMQSEFACHIGFRGKFFCRVCWVKGDPEHDEDDGDGGDKSDGASSISGGSVTGASSGEGGPGANKRKKRGKKHESLADMMSRIGQFMTRSRPRNREQTFGGQAEFKRKKTASGIKDTYQGSFLERIFALSTKRGRSKAQKQADIRTLRRTFPSDITSPVWRIKDFDPHQDTPVEILHVILLGFVKYFWRDAMARVKKSDKDILIARLSSFNVSGLGISSLSGHTLVNYAGSLTGRDFRAIVQAAPFVLQGLLPEKNIRVWTALSSVVTLVWQPHIKDLDKYIVDLEGAIDYFLDCTCDLTLNWFNKPKFHVILHLPAHIRRFGPAMLFATEGFESFNAIIRACSIHSNRHAPSRDIAARMARGNRLRHLLSATPVSTSTSNMDTPWMQVSLSELENATWVTAGSRPLALLDLNSFGSRLLGLLQSEDRKITGTCEKLGPSKAWNVTQSAQSRISVQAMNGRDPNATKVHTPASVILANGDTCGVGDAIVYDDSIYSPIPTTYRRIGSVVEIVQILGSPAEQSGIADFILVAPAIVGEPHGLYHMRRIHPIDEYKCLSVTDIQCTVNLQHNCADHQCAVGRSQVIYQEREKTSERALAVQHSSPTDRILNTGQMRDAAELAQFRFRPQSLVRQDVIRASAELEFLARKKSKPAAQVSAVT
ncbi:hypothetical protein B0H13DRAFT_2232248 [Mycena leptocephala]|nr:hypothetical protein B0H13DRAFT_2232248 [Mycena leptocephala]